MWLWLVDMVVGYDKSGMNAIALECKKLKKLLWRCFSILLMEN